MKKNIFISFIITISFSHAWSCVGKDNHDHDRLESYETHDNHENHKHGDDEIIISPEKAAEFGIETKEATLSAFKEIIKTGGIIEPSRTDLYTVTARKNGVVTLSPDIAEGQSLKAGAKIAAISSEGVQGGDPSLAAATNLTVARDEYNRLKALYDQKLITADRFKEAERIYNEAKAFAGKNNTSGTLTLSTPYSGTLTNLYVTSGEYVETGTPIATITKNSTMTLRADLPARFSPLLPSIETANFMPEGSEITLSLQDMDGKKISGPAAVSAHGGYIPVYFSFSGNPMESPPGYATVFLIGRDKDNVISVPRSALMELQGNKYIYVVEDGDEYEKRKVTTGADNGERVEITSGLEAGEIYVAKGASIVRMAEVSAVAPPSHTHNH